MEKNKLEARNEKLDTREEKKEKTVKAKPHVKGKKLPEKKVLETRDLTAQAGEKLETREETKSQKTPKPLKSLNIMQELIAKKGVTVKKFAEGDLIEGLVVSISTSKILLDIGAKAEGVIKKDQMTDSQKSFKKLKIGDKIWVMVEHDENKQGYVELSIKKAESERKWLDFDKMFKDQVPFEVTALQYNKGGLICDAYGMQGFVPISHLDSARFAEVSSSAKGSDRDIEERMQPLIGKQLKVVIIEFDRNANRLVLSEKQVNAGEQMKARTERLKDIKVGEKIKGIVSGVVPFGLFVDLNGVEGLVHVSEIAWEKVQNPSDYYNVGDKIDAQVLEIDERKGKVGLSLKRLKTNPWEKVAEKYPENTKIKGKVTRVVAFGAFVELEPGLEGLVHISEMAKPLAVGDAVSALVTIVDANEQRLGLSTRKIVEKEVYR
ncbi:30S ribosomal protein S1 [Patescibacteria group bacterium]|nr:30S ribosomal protein S1 [Patescibacteria group bacterium]